MKQILVFAAAFITIILLIHFAGPDQPGSEPELLVGDSEKVAGDASGSEKNTPGDKPAHHESVVNPDANFTHFRVGSRNVKTIHAEDDVVWVGTSGGVIRYDIRNDSYKLFDVKSGLLANGIFHISKYKDRILVGTYGGGMALLKDDGNGWDIYNVPEGLADAFVYDVLEMDNGDVWIATWSGANRVREGKFDEVDKWETFTVKNTGGGLPNDWVYAMARGNDGSVWFATEGGLAHFDNNNWRNWQHDDGLGAPYKLVRDEIEFKNDPSKHSEHHARQKEEYGLQEVDIAYNPNYIVSLLVDSQGNVWCGTWGGGLGMFDGKAWKNYTVKDGLPGNHVFSLYEDTEGKLWVGTSSGLARKDGNTFTVFTTKDGLFANNVFAMTRVSGGDFWIGSYGGVARVANLP